MRHLAQTGFVITTTMAAGLLSSTALAADIVEPGCVPAVSSVNGKLEGAGGYIEDLDDGGRFHGVGTLSLPLGCLFGAQIDAGVVVLRSVPAGVTVIGNPARIAKADTAKADAPEPRDDQ